MGLHPNTAVLRLSQNQGTPPTPESSHLAEAGVPQIELRNIRPCVWIIEDNSGDVFLMQEAFREHQVNCEIFVVSDGEHAMRLVEELDSNPAHPCPQLVLLDINLPKRSGHEVLERIRSSKRCRNVPVLVVTSSDASEDLAKNKRYGATAYFKKPNGLDAFLKLGSVVSDLLKKKN